MRKLIVLLSVVIMTLSTFTAGAKVWYEEKDGKITCFIDYKNDNMAAVNVIGTMTGNWKEPGESMYKNEKSGRWEYKFVMERSKEFYKFFDPAKEGEAAYFEDAEAPEEVANPFGSKNGIVRKPKAGGAAAGPVEEEYPKLNFGMWSRNTYNMVFKSQTSQIISYKKDGTVDNDKVKILSEGGVLVDSPATGYAVADVNLGHRWEGENGTTAGNATRAWLDSTKLRMSSTFKVHGMAFKHMQLDVEVNFNGTVATGYSDYWKAGSADARKEALNTIQRDAASKYMGLLFGPFATMGTWGRFVGEKNNSWDNDPDNNTIWIDQIVISFPFDDVEVKVGILGNNGAASKDPMSLLSGKRTGWKEDVATNLEFYIHPKKVKNLNILAGLAHSWRDMSLEKGEGEVWYSGSRIDNSDRKYYAYLNADYKVSFVDFGALWYWNSWSPSALDMFMNGEMTVAPWVVLKPIKGLTVEAQVATNLSTIYMDSLTSNDNFIDWKTYRTKKEQWDIFANSAALVNVSYVMPNLFNVGLSFKAGGTTFKGMLGNEDAQFSGWCDSSRRVTGITNYADKAVPYDSNDMGASMLTTLDFAITPLKTKLLKIGLKEEFVIGKLDSPLMIAKYDIKAGGDTDEIVGYQANKRQIDLITSPYIGTQYKDLSAEIGVTFSYTNYQDDTLKLDKEQSLQSTNLFTFNKLYLNFSYSNISKILKSIEVDYVMAMDYYEGYYSDTTTTVWDALKDSIQLKTMYNKIGATLYFDKDISFGAGMVIRNYFGDQDNANIYNSLNPAIIEKMTKNDTKTYTKDLKMTNEKLLESYWLQKKDYFNIGGAFQFKYRLPFEHAQYPVLFVNLGIGYNPFDDDGSSTSNWYKLSDTWKVDNTDWNEETSVFTIGMQWDF